MTTYRLTYFDFDGGRGEHVRIALHAAGVDFDDHRISFAEFGELRGGFRFRCAPVMEIDGAQVTQSNALSRYAGKLAGLYPEDALQALYCDEALEALEDMTQSLVRTFGLEGDALKAAREELADGWMTTYLRGLGELLERGGGEYFADRQLTVADLRAFVETRTIQSGRLDHIPTDLVANVAPNLVAHGERVAADDRVVAYYASRS